MPWDDQLNLPALLGLGTDTASTHLVGESDNFRGILAESLAQADAAVAVQGHLLAPQESLLARFNQHVGAIGALIDD